MKRVLLADNSKSYRNVLRQLAEKAQFEIVGEAEDGIDAVEKYKALQPDLVIMDVDLPTVNGIQALKAMKQDDANASVIIITSNDDTDNIRMASYLGAKAYLLKCFSKERIIETITNLKGRGQ